MGDVDRLKRRISGLRFELMQAEKRVGQFKRYFHIFLSLSIVSVMANVFLLIRSDREPKQSWESNSEELDSSGIEPEQPKDNEEAAGKSKILSTEKDLPICAAVFEKEMAKFEEELQQLEEEKDERALEAKKIVLKRKSLHLLERRREDRINKLADEMFEGFLRRDVELSVRLKGTVVDRKEIEKHVFPNRLRCRKAAERLCAVPIVGVKIGASRRAIKAIYLKIVNDSTIFIAPRVFSDTWIEKQLKLEMNIDKSMGSK